MVINLDVLNNSLLKLLIQSNYQSNMQKRVSRVNTWNDSIKLFQIISIKTSLSFRYLNICFKNSFDRPRMWNSLNTISDRSQQREKTGMALSLPSTLRPGWKLVNFIMMFFIKKYIANYRMFSQVFAITCI